MSYLLHWPFALLTMSAFSHLVNAPPDPLHLLSDVVSSSAVLSADRGVNEDGIVGMDGDDNVDQDLAMVRTFLYSDQHY